MASYIFRLLRHWLSILAKLRRRNGSTAIRVYEDVNSRLLPMTPKIVLEEFRTGVRPVFSTPCCFRRVARNLTRLSSSTLPHSLLVTVLRAISIRLSYVAFTYLIYSIHSLQYATAGTTQERSRGKKDWTRLLQFTHHRTPRYRYRLRPSVPHFRARPTLRNRS